MEERQKGITEIGKETEERLSGIVHTSEAPTGELTEPKAKQQNDFVILLLQHLCTDLKVAIPEREEMEETNLIPSAKK